MTRGPAIALSDFVGLWAMDRRITDHRGGPDGHFTGTAEFTPTETGLAYLETGLLTLEGHTAFKAERRYQWRLVDGTISVDFHDGRAFHSFDPATPVASHWCDPDTYHVTYDFAEWPVWHSIWTVSGPQKAYEMITNYTRSAQ